MLQACDYGMDTSARRRETTILRSEVDEPVDPVKPAPWDGDAAPPPPAPPERFASSATCAGCHPSIVQQWSKSMHARAHRAGHGRADEPGRGRTAGEGVQP